ncbi:hypothetical protein KGY73_08930 [bacterium]|nr:hypothetical protein [bacterium]
MSIRHFIGKVCVFLCLSLLVFYPFSEMSAQEEITPAIFKNIQWRNIGPANMMGRTTDVEGVPGKPDIVYVGTATGGIWKTTNGGTTWEPLFDDQPVSSIGDLALEPGNPHVIYAGTGESNVRNSVSFGNGVYKSTDGGKTWNHMGLEETRHISRIVINPHHPQIVYVGALGHAFGPNQQRGVLKSTDGGNTWEKVLYLDKEHGVSDMALNVQNPNILFAGMWRFQRKPWTFTTGSKKGGLFRSIDGGKNWEKVQGLPELIGRIGVKVSRSEPQVVYAITASKEGTLFRSEDGGKNFHKVSEDVSIVSRGFYYTDMRIDPEDENRIYAVSSRLYVSEDGGKHFERISESTHVDFHALWIDPQDPSRMWQGQDGGIAVSYDRGKNWDYVNVFPVGQFYQIYADNRKPFYYVGGGLQDNGTWYGPHRTREPAGILNDDWRMISFGDGFHIVSHPENPELFLSESQGGNIVRTNMETREQQDVSPQQREGSGAPESELKYRFNWNTPIVASPHDQETVYVGGNVVFKTKNFGSTWEVISPDLTTNNPEKQKTPGKPAWPENTTAEYHCTIISLAESPVQPGVLWAGTDDGNLHVSKDGGGSWTNVIDNVPNLPPFSSVSHVEPSVRSAGMAYVTFDRHMLDNFNPYVYRTRDFGKTWTNVTGNLPENAYIWVLREDPQDSNILYAGTERGLYVSFTRGSNWIKLHMKNLPTVPVHDILIHPRENDLILGTHGRSLWICDDITFLQEVDAEMFDQTASLAPIRDALRFAVKFTRYGIGERVFTGENPPYGALITYYLKKEIENKKNLYLQIMDDSGQVVRELKKIPAKEGFNRIAWDLRYKGPRPREEKEKEEEGFFSRGPQGPRVLPGTYTVRLHAKEKTYKQPVEVKVDPKVEVSMDDLKTQLKYTLQLRDMISYVNDGLRAMDILEKQLKERKETLKKKGEMAGELKDIMEKHMEKIKDIKNLLTRPEGEPFWSQGARVKGRLRNLFRTIDGVNAAPSNKQMEYFKVLQEEYRSVMAEVNGYLSQSAKELNSKLSQHQVPELLIPEIIQISQ